MDLHFPAAVHGRAPVKKQWNAPAVVWCVLCGLTLLSVALVEGGWSRSVASIAIVLIAVTKSRVIILHYMEANRAARHWRFLYETWNFAVAATIVIGYVMGRGMA